MAANISTAQRKIGKEPPKATPGVAAAAASVKSPLSLVSKAPVKNGGAGDKPSGPSARRPTHSYLDVFLAQPLLLVQKIRAGLPAKSVEALAKQMQVPKEQICTYLRISTATLNRKEREDKPLSVAESERILGLERLVGQVEAMVQESGNPQGFDAGLWLAQWLEQPIGALSGLRPCTLIDTSEGLALVSTLIARMQSGSYS